MLRVSACTSRSSRVSVASAGGLWRKTLTPQVRRDAASKMIEQLDIPERRTCRLVGLSRTSYREPPTISAQTTTLSARIVELAYECRRFGYRRIHDLLAREGHAVNQKRV